MTLDGNGWELLVEWNNGTSDRILLKDLKDITQVNWQSMMLQYEEPAFKRCVVYTLTKRY